MFELKKKVKHQHDLRLPLLPQVAVSFHSFVLNNSSYNIYHMSKVHYSLEFRKDPAPSTYEIHGLKKVYKGFAFETTRKYPDYV